MNWTRRVPRLRPVVAIRAHLAVTSGVTAQQPAGQAGRGRQGPGGGRGADGAAASLFALIDTNKDAANTRAEMKAVFDKWYGDWDSKKSNALTQEQVFMGVIAAFLAPAAGQTPPQNQTPRPEHVKAMMAALPETAPFKGQEYVIVDETYTWGRDTYSRQNLRVLTSIDYSKMSVEDKAKEQNPRSDGDYALSWIRREGKGRVFYEAHGHNEKVYAIKPMLEHTRADMQYLLGDLQADGRPSVGAAK